MCVCVCVCVCVSQITLCRGIVGGASVMSHISQLAPETQPIRNGQVELKLNKPVKLKANELVEANERV